MKRGRLLDPEEMGTLVLLSLGLLVAVTGPLMKNRKNENGSLEAHVSAVIIQRAVADYARKTTVAEAQTLAGRNLGDPAVQKLLNITASGLPRTPFTVSEYTITSVDSEGVATIRIAHSNAGASQVSYLLKANGDWAKL